ncbi:MAG TPA: GAF domain-containing protein [Ktedonobacteraceae bacterium]|nr:GAF domain-containing protein [Ktedonobacteraceae bacterium]
MEEIQTWRELLGRLTNDPQERQRIADAMSINSVTLTRWVTGRSNPRQDNLRPLLDALPQHRQQLAKLIAKEFPQFFVELLGTENDVQEIPSAFYARILNAHTTSPSQLRAASVCLLILQQILAHLDPQQFGMAVIVAQCVPPSQGQKVRSLRKTFARGTGPWHSQIEIRTEFFGAESQPGHSVLTSHPIVVQNHEEKQRLFPTHCAGPESESIAAYPILLADRTAGSFCLLSSQPEYFTQARRDLVQDYVNLLVMAFERSEFYNLNNIELGIMPNLDIQNTLLKDFHYRVTQLMIQASQNNQHLIRPEAERIVWQEFEEELLHYSLH